MGRTACTEPQCLYKGALYTLLIINRKSSNPPVTVNALLPQSKWNLCLRTSEGTVHLLSIHSCWNWINALWYTTFPTGMTCSITNTMCVCVCVCECIYIYIYIYICNTELSTAHEQFNTRRQPKIPSPASVWSPPTLHVVHINRYLKLKNSYMLS